MISRNRDLDNIMTVMEAAFDPAYGEAWNRRQVCDALALPNTYALIVDAEGQVLNDINTAKPAGFVLTRHVAGEEELLLIAVIPQYRKRGLGECLMRRFFAAALARGASHIFLEMRDGNPAIHLYHKVGFKPIGKRNQYYRMQSGKHIDAITFKRTIQ